NLAPVAIGWGKGTLTLPDRPNALRVVLGDRLDAAVTEESSAALAPTCGVVEANLDDATGELLGHALAALLAAGALDAWASPITMKKGRPGHVLSALAPLEDLSRISEVMLRETTSIGVRCYPVSRTVRPRVATTVETPYGALPVKISSGP